MMDIGKKISLMEKGVSLTITMNIWRVPSIIQTFSLPKGIGRNMMERLRMI